MGKSKYSFSHPSIFLYYQKKMCSWENDWDQTLCIPFQMPLHFHIFRFWIVQWLSSVLVCRVLEIMNAISNLKITLKKHQILCQQIFLKILIQLIKEKKVCRSQVIVKI